MTVFLKYLIKVNIPVFLLALILPFFFDIGLATVYGFVLTYILCYVIGYNFVHRSICHGQFKLKEPFYFIIGYLSLFVMLSDPLNYSKGHRYHHKHSDTDLDLHSPKKGKFNSFIGWMWSNETPTVSIMIVKDLLKNKSCMFLANHQFKLIWGSILLSSLISVHFTIGILFCMCLSFILEMASNAWFQHDVNGVKNNTVYAWATLGSYHIDHHNIPSTMEDRDPGRLLIKFFKFIKIAS
jgi:fatty-acid desaturase